MKVRQLAVLVGFGMLSLSSVQGSAIISTGNASMNENVLFGHATCAGCVDGPATTIVGHGQTSNILVDFSNPVSLVISGANTITYDPANQSAGFTTLSIFAPGYYITGIMFQLTEISTVTDGSYTLTANLAGGGTVTYPVGGADQMLLHHQGGGTNQFNVTTNGGTLISSIGISSALPLHDISQVSISLQAVPEPGTFAMVGAGLVAGLAMYRRRRK